MLRLEPGHAEARHMLAASHFDRMEHEEAVRQLLILVATRPEWAIPRANLSLALEARGDLEAAIHHLRAAIARAPGEASYGVRLARLEGLRGTALAAESPPARAA